MLHLRPIPQAKANDQIKNLYKEIEDTLQVETVPLFFQYLANYENYFSFLWERMKINLHSEKFRLAYEEIRTFANQAVIHLPTPSIMLTDFINSISPIEKNQIVDTVSLLEKMNIILMLMTQDIREGMKSVYINSQRLTYSTSYGTREEADFEDRFQNVLERQENKELAHGTRFLVPLFGENALVISQYQEFFTKISLEMEFLQKSEGYLHTRVLLERAGLAAIPSFIQPLGCTYKQFIQLTQSKTFITELLYIITDAFPSQFPHLVLTTAVMQKALKKYQPQETLPQ